MSAFESISRSGPTMDILDVRDYGAVFDNSTDDTAAIQAALDDAPLADGYSGLHGSDLPARAVAMPAGRAKITSALQIGANTMLFGMGSGATYISNYGSGNTIELKSACVQTHLRDFGIILNGSTMGIDYQQSAFASILGDAAHRIQNIVVVGGTRAFICNSDTELRILDFMAYRQTVANGDAAFYLGGTDHMVQNVTVAQVQTIGTGEGGSAFRAATSNTRFINCKVFGGNANGTTETQQPAFRLIGGRNQVIGLEIQDYPGWGVDDDQGLNTYAGLVVDSCLGGAAFLCSSGPVMATAAHILNRGGTYTMTEALDVPDGKGCVIDCMVESVASNFHDAQDGTGNFIRINGVSVP